MLCSSLIFYRNEEIVKVLDECNGSDKSKLDQFINELEVTKVIERTIFHNHHKGTDNILYEK